MLPSGAAGKRFINELNRILNLWTDKSSFKNVALEKIHVLSGLLLQKPSKSSKEKDHLNAYEKSSKLWEEGKILELLDENRTIQERIPSSNTP